MAVRQTESTFSELRSHSLWYTQRMLEICDQTQDCGIKTLQLIHLQGEQLENIDKDLDTIKDDLNESEKRLSLIDSNEKSCFPFWIRHPFKAHELNKINKKKKNALKNGKLKGKRANSNKEKVGKSKKGKLKITEKKKKKKNLKNLPPQIIQEKVEKPQFEKNMNKNNKNKADIAVNKNLDKISAKVDILKDHAIEMGDSIGEQNEFLDKINLKAHENQIRLKRANRRVYKINRTN